MKKLLVIFSSVVVVLGLLTVVTYANDWLFFEGENDLTQSTAHVDEILNLLQEVQDGKLDAEEKLKAFEGINIDELRKDIKELTQKNSVLTTDLAAEQQKVRDEQQKVIDTRNEMQREIDRLDGEVKSKQGEIDRKQGEVAEKQRLLEVEQQAHDRTKQERDGKQTKIDELQAKLDRSGDPQEIAHLKEQLRLANQKVDSHEKSTKSQLDRAKEIVGTEE